MMFKPARFLCQFTTGPICITHPLKYRQRKITSSLIRRSSTFDQSNRKFQFKKALIVTKLSRYEFEQHKNPKLTMIQLEKLLRDRGTDYDLLLHYHRVHKDFEQKVANCFEECGIDVKLVNRVTLSTKQTEWADIVVPIGGDGTFLLTASRACPIFCQSKPIIGFNSDPDRSEGRLMLSKRYSHEPKEAVQKLIQGDFEWLYRTRIRTTMLGQNGNLPKSFDLQELEPTPMELNEYPTEMLDETDQTKYRAKVKRILPYLALNEVFIGETQSARVSHLHLQIDNQNVLNKTKSSGLCVSTGTGSSSWLTSINRLSTQNVRELLKLIKQNDKNINLNAEDIAEKYNDRIKFNPGDPRMCYSIREQICVGVWPKPKGFESKGYAKNLQIKSRCVDASLVIDGSIAYPFNDGAKVLLEVYPEDALQTVIMDER
ncbi:NAD kinase 2, mitochondrial [Contarinia nasturtii]|uniref:NAD kinase 2, mitochondrial n=1 Tax=Contarinia nasturtii TaxID=265458 RepID=UPI0012D3EB14|nr:NAD kinase 2, mitochondrial [Contarinia nasturtii]